MTPLAQRFFGQLTKPLKDRQDDPDNVLGLVEDLHCFEVSALYWPVRAALDSTSISEAAAVLHSFNRLFLPSPRTLLELNRDGNRICFILEKASGGSYKMFIISGYDALASMCLGVIRLLNPAERGFPGFTGAYRPTQDKELAQIIVEQFEWIFAQCIMYLDIINTPGLVGFKTHQPHRGLERNLRRAGVGSYPLRAWSEIVLKSDPPELGDEEREGHLTGRKCLHFVRAHRRHYGRGFDTIVSAHWRGDAALGMKRNRYRVEG